MPLILRQMWRLLRLCISGSGGLVGLGLLAVVFVLSLGGIYIQLRLIEWSAQFYTALEKHDSSEAVSQIGIFGILIGLGAAQFLVATYLRKIVQIRWRYGLTSICLDRWLADKSHLYLSQAGAQGGVDNPDQRIAEDCCLFVTKLTEEGLELVSNVIGITSYVTVLWSLSSFALPFTLFGLSVEIPRYMVWAAPIYVLISSGLTHYLGRPLMALTAEQQRREADFRFALARLRQSSDAVALMQGEAAERRVLDARFADIAFNWRQLMNRELIMGCFVRPYFMTVLRIPIFLALPAYLAGTVALGGLMKLASAFQNVVTTLSWFIFSYRDLAELAATARRLETFLGAVGHGKPAADTVRQAFTADGALGTHGMALTTPAGRTLDLAADFLVARGESVWLSGPSGIGKSTLIKALAGLWPHGAGAVTRPEGQSLAFLPQAVYLPLCSLRGALAYPQDPGLVSREAFIEVLGLVGLEHRLADLDNAEVPQGLSGGELQRLALARLILARPDWAVLDEPTGALDAAAEEKLLSVLRTALPRTSFVVISHREPVGLGDLRKIDLQRYLPEAPATAAAAWNAVPSPTGVSGYNPGRIGRDPLGTPA
jgi:putative ATP-binding cassette transporter